MAGFHVYRREGTSVLWCNFTVAGKSFRLATGKRDPTEADEAAARLFLEAHQRARVPVPPEAVERRLAVLCPRFLRDLKHRLERRELVRNPKYYTGTEGALARVTQRFVSLDEIEPNWSQALADWHADGASWRYLQIVTVAARQLLRWAHALEGRKHKPQIEAPSAEDVTAEAKERRPMTAAERNRFLRALDPAARRLYIILFYTAARKSDLERLTLRQVNWRSGFVSLPPRQTKSRKRDQVLYLQSKAMAALRAEVRARKVVDPGALIFPNVDLRAAFRQALAATGIDPHGLTPHHSTRYTAATLAAEEGATLDELMAFGRWSTPQMAQRYMRVNAAKAKKAAERL